MSKTGKEIKKKFSIKIELTDQKDRFNVIFIEN